MSQPKDDDRQAKKSKADENATAADAKVEKSDVAASTAPVDSDLARKILIQIEFYFGDNNFVRDKFLRGETAKNAEGWFPVAKLLTFKRLRELTSDASVVASSIAESDVVELSADKLSLRRRHPLPEQLNLTDSAIYSKPYPVDVKFELISEFWTKTVGPVAATRLRRDVKNAFKGSVFVEFRSPADAKRAVELAAAADGLAFAGQKLTVELKADYLKRKAAEHANDPVKPRRASKKDDAAAASTADGAAASTADAAAKDAAAAAAAKEPELHFTPGCIVKIDGLGIIPDRSDLKAALEPFGVIEYVDYTDRAEHGFVRFSEPDAAQAALDAFAGGKREIFGKVPALSLVEGEAERDYWRAIVEHGKKKAGGGRGGGRRGGGRGGRGGRGRGSKRRRD